MKFSNKIIKCSSIFCILIKLFSLNVYATENNMKIIGHRGASALAPENTIPAYEKAAQNGMWGAEGDLYELKDGNMVIFHDETVDRVTDGCGKIVDMTLEEVKRLNIDSGNYINNYNNLKIPTLDEYLYCCKTNNLVPVIDFKTINIESVKTIVEKIIEYELEDVAIIISTDAKWIKYIREYTDKITFQYLADITPENIGIIKKYGNCGIDIRVDKITKNKIELAHSNGCSVNVWTVNNEDDIKMLFNLGVDMITSDLIGKIN